MSANPASIARRHDLDALRAVAMIAGIFLHGMMSFAPLPGDAWPVQDIGRHHGFDIAMSVVHGFRMQLFFLISGFFTAMLWRKRGLKALLNHRFKRIFLPLLIGMFTIIPVCWITAIGIGISTQFGGLDGADRTHDSEFWTALRQRDIPALKQHMDPQAIDELHPTLHLTPLCFAAMADDIEMLEFLLDSGADLDARNKDGATALHGAALLGRYDCASRLLEAGIDPKATDGKDTDSVEALEAPWGVTSWVATALDIEVDRDDVEQGREEIAKLFASQADATSRTSKRQANEPNAKTDQKDDWLSKTVGVFVFLGMIPVFMHLWFLWFLCWLVVAFAFYAWLMGRLNQTSFSYRFIVSPYRYLWLIPLTLLPQCLMGLLYPVFGPDTSSGIVPLPHLLFYYAIFFFFGAMYFDCGDTSGQLGRWWRITIPVSLLVVFPVGYEFAKGGLGFAHLIDESMHRPITVVAQVLYAWLMTFGLMGFFRSCCSAESRVMRYVSDSSYWLYLVHIPLMMVLQYVVRAWQMSAVIKYALVCVVACTLLLISYTLFVRYTPIGTLLNGKRYRIRSSQPMSAEVVS